MIINDLDGYYIVFDTKNWNTELDTLVANAPIVVAKDAKGNEVKIKESVSVKNSTWQGENSIYCPYPTTEVEKNPNLKR